jgi:hypothetical protein
MYAIPRRIINRSLQIICRNDGDDDIMELKETVRYWRIISGKILNWIMIGWYLGRY